MWRCCRVWRAMTPRAALNILALPVTADLTHATIKKAYIKQTLNCHPDLHPNDPNATEKFRNLSDALHVALQTLEMRRGLSKETAAAGGGGQAGEGEEGLYTPQQALEALRRAIVAYHVHRDTDTTAAAAAPHAAAPSPPQDDVFFTPSLEYVSAVCQQEALAMQRVQTFCAELPVVLCGSSSAALMEAIAFFYTRYVASMSACVLRFSKNLPIIVRRVVKNRRRFVRYKQTKATSGIGTGTRPREQRIEDMSMKPLVLVGALIFDLPENKEANLSLLSGEVSSSTSGVTRPSDLRVTDELKCIIYPSDSIGDIVEKMGAWEGASFHRLQLELAIVDATSLLSGLLSMDEDVAGTGSHPLVTAPHLELTARRTEALLLTLQKLAADLCFDFDAAASFVLTGEEVGAIVTADDVADAADDAAALRLSVPALVSHCGHLYRAAAPSLKGNVNLTWRGATALVETPDELAAAATTTAAAEDTVAPAEVKAHVNRNLACCTAEMLDFSVSVELTKNLRLLLLRVRKGLKTVAQQAERSRQQLAALLELREKTVKEEFIPNETEEEVADEEQRTYRYRGPIHCFPRLYNITTSQELSFWQHIYAHREYIAQHAQTTHAFNLYFECLPYPHETAEGADPQAYLSSQQQGQQQAEAPVLAGWMGESGHDNGCDDVTLTTAELKDTAAFKDWLEEILAQSALNKEAQLTLQHAGVGYVSRDPALPLTHFLSFVKVFTKAVAVRTVLEKRGASEHYEGGRVLYPRDVQLSIIVGHRCDVRDGGQLFIPWYMDPSILLALLEEADATKRIE